jgi:HlyD family secretion protein
VDAFPNRSFRGRVTQVRNAAKVLSNVVSYDTIIEVANEDQKLKPGMTANVSIVIAQRNNVLRVANSTLRVRVPAELVAKPAEPAAEKTAPKSVGPALSDEERRRVTMEIMREAGWAGGTGGPPTPATPEMIAKAQELAKGKGLELDFTRFATMGQRGGRRGGAGNAERAGPNAVVTNRTVYKLNNSDPKKPMAQPVTVRLGVSDGFFTEVLDGLQENDTLITNVTLPGQTQPMLQAPGGGASNPFQGGGRGGFGGGGRGR